MSEQMDFRPRPSAAFAAAFEQFIDEAMTSAKAKADAEYRGNSTVMARPGLGAGRLGHDCLRKIAYEYHRTPAERDFSGRLLRIFDRGHMHEAKMVEYLRLAGFTVLDKTAKGGQFRYDIAPYEDGKGRIKGFGDAVITAGPPFLLLGDHEQTCQAFQLRYPMLWENKELGDKSFKKLTKGGLRAYEGDYFPQVQMGMFHLGLTDNPALFTCKNADTQELYAELVPVDQAFLQETIDKSVRVIATRDPEEMPRVASKATDFRCKLCDYAERCWRQPDEFDVPAANAAWSFGRIDG